MNPLKRLTLLTSLLTVLLLTLLVSYGSRATTAVSASGSVELDPLQIVLDHLDQNRADYGLVEADLSDYLVTDLYKTSDTGVTHVYLRQRINGIEVWKGNLNANILPDGSILTLNSAFVPHVDRALYAGQPALTAAEALNTAAQELNWPLSEYFTSEQNFGGANQSQILSNGGISRNPIPTKLVYVMGENGELILAWEAIVERIHTSDWWQMTVDATTGRVLAQINWTVSHNPADIALSDARTPFVAPAVALPTDSVADGSSYQVYAQPVESPIHSVPASPADGRTTVNEPADDTASPFGWHDTNGAAGAEFTTTEGNNVHAYTDTDASNTPDAGSSPDGGAGLDFLFALDLTQAPSTYRPAAVTNLFYWNNITHDLLYSHGFDEASGNFQVNNYGRGGLGNDSVQAEAQDGGGINNANFGTPADGSRPRMQMFNWNTTTPGRDGDFDAGIIAHEYGHGWSNRLTGGPSNVGCLGNAEQMGEGWSDYLTVVFTARVTDTATTNRGVGTYALGQATTDTGIRAFPYNTDMGIDPRTYADTASATVPHGVGSIWTAMLWEVYWNLVDEYGFNPNLYEPWNTGGNNLALRLVTDGLKMQSCDPGFVDGRDAILAADVALTGGVNQCLIWEGFAKRGLGFNASQGSSNSNADNTQDFAIPAFCQGVNVTPPSQTICAGTNAVYNVIPGSDFTTSVTLSALNNPVPTSIDFTPNPVAVGQASVLTVGNTAAVTAADYPITIIGTEGPLTRTFEANLTVVAAVPGVATLSAPADEALNQQLQPTFSWSAVPNTVDYLLEVATDAGFSSLVYTTTEETTSHDLPVNLEGGTQYFWRVSGNNVCGAGGSSATFSFTTLNTTAVCPAGTSPVVAYETDFESGATDWTSSGTGNTWTLSGARPNSGSTSWFAVDTETLSDQRLVSPPIIIPDLSQAPLTLEFANYQAFETPNNDGRCWDAAILEVSTNGGSSWNQVPNTALITDPYDALIWNEQPGNNPLGPVMAWCPNPPPQEYLNSIVDLTAYANQTVNFRWRLGTDSAAGNEGWYVDDVKVQSCVADPISYGVALSADSAQSDVPGTTVTYTVQITNTGNTTDTFDLTVAGETWNTQLSVSDIELVGGEMGSFEVAVEIPAGATGNELDTAVVTATSQGDNAESDAVSLTTTAEAVYDLAWSVDSIAQEGAAGIVVTYTFMLTNTGNTTDTVDVALAGNEWNTAVSDSSLTLGSGESAQFTVAVTIDAGAIHPADDMVTVSATSQGDSNVTASVNLTTSVAEVVAPPNPVIYLPMIMRP